MESAFFWELQWLSRQSPTAAKDHFLLTVVFLDSVDVPAQLQLDGLVAVRLEGCRIENIRPAATGDQATTPGGFCVRGHPSLPERPGPVPMMYQVIGDNFLQLVCFGGRPDEFSYCRRFEDQLVQRVEAVRTLLVCWQVEDEDDMGDWPNEACGRGEDWDSFSRYLTGKVSPRLHFYSRFFSDRMPDRMAGRAVGP